MSELKRQVRGHGPTIECELVVVGEAPGEDEIRVGRPFVGPSGRLLREQLQTAGFNPENVRYENVIERTRRANGQQWILVETLPLL